MKKKIAIGGAPLSGKTSILKVLAKTLQSKILTLDYKSEYIWYFNTNILEYEVTIHTTQGVLFYEERTYEYTLSVSDAVVYVFSGDPALEEHQERQARFFNRYVDIAKKAGKCWDKIPWLIAFSYLYDGGIIPSSVVLPDYLKKDIINISLGDEEVIKLLLDRILSLLNKEGKSLNVSNPT